jgi:formylglycine-generating enzyme required for sulfatase activity
MVLSVGLFLTFWAGCTEEEPTNTDSTPPSVSVTHPLSFGLYGVEVRDTTTIIVRATDNDAISEVEVFYHVQGDTTTKRIGVMAVTDSADYYAIHWEAAGIPNGSECLLRARATDRAGNQAASEAVRVLVIIVSEIGPPHANFVISPSEGKVLTEFAYDASLTDDDISDPEELLVRWDFEGDGIWDRDTTEHLDVTDEVYHTYAIPDTYQVVLEVFNDYYSVPLGLPDRKERRLVVKPAHGDPRPPDGQELLRVAAGDYPIGVVACTPSDSCDIFDLSETVDSTLTIRISNDYYIDKYEVTNRLYLDFLNAVMDSGWIFYDVGDRSVRSAANSTLLMTLADNLTRVKIQMVDSTFWSDEDYLDHPVVGVTWHGAYEYGAFYGLRLPTEAEWEVAARATAASSLHMYPWDAINEIDNSYANYYGSYDPFEGQAIATTPVGAYNGLLLGDIATKDAQGPFGTYDQAGNAAEWVADWFDATAYGDLLAQAGLVIDPQGPPIGADKVLRGGSWSQFPHGLRLTMRQAIAPRTTSSWIGFRTAYTKY